MVGKETYLEFLREYGLSEAEVLPMFDFDKLPENVRKYSHGMLLHAYLNRDKLDDFERDLITRWIEQIPKKKNSNSLVSYLLGEIRDEFKLIDVEVSKNCFAGVFPTNSFNAQCLLKNGGYLILIDTGFIEIVEAVVTAFFSDNDTVEKENFIFKTIMEYCENYTIPNVKSGDFPGYESLRYRQEIIATKLANSFILTHELGHIFNGHCDNNSNSMFFDVPLVENSSRLQLIKKSFVQEFEADAWAAYNLIKRSELLGKGQRIYIELTCLGQVVCLGLAALLEGYYKKKGMYVDSHPSTKERIYNLQFLYELMGHEDKISLASEFLEIIEKVFYKFNHDYLEIPFLDREYNRTFFEVVDKMNLPVDIPKSMREFI